MGGISPVVMRATSMKDGLDREDVTRSREMPPSSVIVSKVDVEIQSGIEDVGLLDDEFGDQNKHRYRLSEMKPAGRFRGPTMDVRAKRNGRESGASVRLAASRIEAAKETRHAQGYGIHHTEDAIRRHHREREQIHPHCRGLDGFEGQRGDGGFCFRSRTNQQIPNFCQKVMTFEMSTTLSTLHLRQHVSSKSVVLVQDRS